jgi:predicted ATPase/class 3 adenylate cyclase
MIGADLLERFRRAGLEAAGQNRNVTVLFVDLSDYTTLSHKLDNEDLYEIIRQFLQVLASTVYKYEGMVDKFTGDGLMALFGAPIAHENNAELAVRAALDMQEEIGELSKRNENHLGRELRIHIGLNSGPVIVGGIGSDLLMNYTAIGDTVNLARRLQDAASPGSILVSEIVFRQTKAMFEYLPCSPLSLKGVEHPVKVFQAVGRKAQPRSGRGIESLYAPMIGREAEFSQLTTAVKDLQRKKTSQIVFVTGEAGIGKSRLINELKEQLESDEITVLEGQSLTYRRLAAYWIFVDALRKYLGVTPGSTEIQVRSKLKQRLVAVLGERGLEALPYLEHMLSLSPSNEAAQERIRYLDASQLRQQIFLAVRDLLKAEARQRPFLLILEDIHWADQTSLDLLSFLLESAPNEPLMFLCVSRPFQEGSLWKVFETASQKYPNRCSHIQLQSLSALQSEQLIHELLAITDLPARFKDYILQRAAGVPFYLEEIIRMLIDNGILQRENQNWKINGKPEVRDLGIPDTLEGLILARFDRLHESQRRVLQAAAVIGREFSLPVLHAVVPALEESELHTVLQQLQERDFILLGPDSHHTEYAFKHALMSDAIYKTMLKRERSEMHGKIGAALEQIYANRIESQVEIIARHYSWSPRHQPALRYLILAGKKAARNYDNEQSYQYFEHAKELLSQVEHTPIQMLAVFSGLGDVLLFTGEYAPARENYLSALEALSCSEALQCYEDKSDLHRKLGATYERQGEYSQALACLSEAQKALQDSPTPSPLALAQIANDTGWVQFLQGNNDEAEQYLTAALGWMEDSNHYDLIASIYNRLGGVYFQKEQLDQASNFVRKSLVLREEMGDAAAVARSYNNLGLLAWRKGDWDEALENFQRSVELHSKLSDVEGTLNLRANIGLLLTDRGNLEEAQANLEESLQVAQKIGHSFMEGLAYHHLSRLWLAAQEWEKSLFFSNQAFRVFTEIGAQDNLVDVYSSIGEAWLGLGRLEDANQACESALKLLQEGDNQSENVGEGRVLRLKGNLTRIQGDYEAAASLFKRSANHFSSLGIQLELGRTLVSIAALDLARRDQTAFRLHVNEARLIFRQLGAKLDLKSLTRLTPNMA